MIFKGMYIKHKFAKDVCYYVKSVNRYGNTTRYKLDIWNMGFESSWKIEECIVENIEVNNFQILNGERKECLRYCDWLDISL